MQSWVLDMSMADMSFIGRVDPTEASAVLSLIGRACSSDKVVRTGLTVAASDEARAAAASLMDMRGILRGTEGEDRFPLAVRASGREGGRLLSVELHPLMRGPDALGALIGHLVGGIPGRLVRRLWGRWGETVSEPTEQMMDAVGAGHMRFPQFGEEVLKPALARSAAVAGLSLTVGTERGGRGSKVVRVTIRVGDAPSWIAGPGPERIEPDVEPNGMRLAAPERAAFYGMTHLGVVGGKPLTVVTATVRDWLASSADDADRRIAAVADACSTRGNLHPTATAVEAVMLSLPNMVDGLRLLSEVPWPDGPAGIPASKAWALRAAACVALSGTSPQAGLRALRLAVDADERAAAAVPADAAVLRATFTCLLDFVRDPSPGSGEGSGMLDRRDRLALACTVDGPSAAQVLLSLAARASRQAE